MGLGEVAFYFQAEVFGAWAALGVLVFWAAVWILHGIAIAYGKWRLHGKATLEGREGAAPGVSIIKPLVGVDPNLGPNLETFFTLAYPGEYELLFCLHSAEDPANVVVESLVAKYPAVSARVFRHPAEVGVNPKVNNMAPAYDAARHPLVLISDSGIRMRPDTLSDMVSAMTERVGLVSQMPFVCDQGGGFSSALEKVFFGTWQARMYLGADFLRIICCTGMSCLLRRSVLEELGGLKAFGAYIAEDQFMAKGVVAKGWRLAVASQPAWQNPGQTSVRRLQERVARWAKLRIAMMPWSVAVEPLQECFLLGLAAAWATWFLFAWSALVVLLVHCLAWMLLDYVLLAVVQAGPMPFGKLEFALTWLYRELSALPIFLYALLHPDIAWRNSGVYRLRWGGRARKVRDPAGRPVPPELQYGPGPAQPLLPDTTPPETSILIHSDAEAPAGSSPRLSPALSGGSRSSPRASPSARPSAHPSHHLPPLPALKA